MCQKQGHQNVKCRLCLSRCTSQNANESLHSGVTAQKKRLEISVVTTVSEFNFGSLFTLKHIHQNASLPSMQISGDERRLKQSRSITFQIAKDKRNMKRKISNKIENIHIKSEELSYCAGQF
ncbi:hypothetical protein TNCV_2635441 [Trichonephila clavipes]|nr:hypothetical protein TNCV_2635441 [Trichonephila clavipes]